MLAYGDDQEVVFACCNSWGSHRDNETEAASRESEPQRQRERYYKSERTLCTATVRQQVGNRAAFEGNRRLKHAVQGMLLEADTQDGKGVAIGAHKALPPAQGSLPSASGLSLHKALSHRLLASRCVYLWL